MIHTVGPVWYGGDEGEAELLASCYRESLRLARENDVLRIAFPAISCGVFGYPIEAATAIAVREARAWLAAEPLPNTIVLCCFGTAIERACRHALDAG